MAAPSTRDRTAGGAMQALAGAIGAGPSDWARAADPHAQTLDAIAADLRGAQGRALIHVGVSQDAAVHALGAALNHALGAHGQTLSVIEPVAPPPPAGSSLNDLTDAMAHGHVDTLIILADNPVYGAAADLDFARALRTVPFSIYLGEYADETAEAVHWHVPRAHEYEAWSDVRAFDGTISIQQPQMLPSGERHSAHRAARTVLGADHTGWPRNRARAVAGEGAERRHPRFRHVLDGRVARWHRARHGRRADRGPAARRSRGRARIAGRSGASRRRARRALPAGPLSLGRTLRGQRLAAGDGAAVDTPHLGQCGAGEPGHRAPARTRDGDMVEVRLDRPAPSAHLSGCCLAKRTTA